MSTLAPSQPAGLLAVSVWAERAGITPITAWRWRKKGWLKTINICGRQYISSEEIERFSRRAESGEFAKEHVVPTRAAI